MKKPLVALLLLACAGTVFGGAFLDFFQGRSDGDNIVLEWRSRTESNITSYEVQRKAGYNSAFIPVATVDPRGANSLYSWTDRSAYKTSNNLYIYRLKIVEGASASYSNEITVSHSVSSVKRTWGSIKAMFR
jgi:hypothetical protein